MWILILILAGVILLGLIAGYFYNRNLRKKIEKGELEETPEVKPVDGTFFRKLFGRRNQRIPRNHVHHERR